LIVNIIDPSSGGNLKKGKEVVVRTEVRML
jgi:hypothetical protein